MNVTLQGVSYEYEVVGSGEPLLLLHGFTEAWKRGVLLSFHGVSSFKLL